MEKYTHLGVYGILINDNKILLIKKSRGPHKGKWIYQVDQSSLVRSRMIH